MKKALENIVQEIKYDLEQGRRNNDYIKDVNAKKLKEEINGLKDVGVQVYNLERDTTLLAWFVGGDPQKIKELQKALNQLGIRGSHGVLKVDGVYGKETDSAWNSFAKVLVSGSVPTLGFINPLQTNLTGYQSTLRQTNANQLIREQYSHTVDWYPTSFTSIEDVRLTGDKSVFQLDKPHYEKGVPLPYHINYKLNAPDHLKTYFYDTKEISEAAYWKLKNFGSYAKFFRVSGKLLLVGGVALDAVEIKNAIQLDYSADNKLGKQSVEAVAVAGGRWGGSALGAKLGAMAGAAAGTAIFPVVGTAIGGAVVGLIGGGLGAWFGGEIAECVVDITVLEG